MYSNVFDRQVSSYGVKSSWAEKTVVTPQTITKNVKHANDTFITEYCT